MESLVGPLRVRLLGGELDIVTPPEMLAFVDVMAAAGGPALIASHSARSLCLMRRSRELRAFFEDADLVQIASGALIFWGRLLGLPLKGPLRGAYRDWREDFWRLARERQWRVFFLGGRPGVAKAACQRIAERWRGVTLGAHHGDFDAAPKSRQNRQVLAKIAAFQPDVLFVGLGMPRQEGWVLDNRAALTGGVIFTVGEAIDIEAGLPQPSLRDAAQTGLARLAHAVAAPARLVARRLIEPWSLVGPALEDLGVALRRTVTH